MTEPAIARNRDDHAQRRMAHTDAERVEARARLRVAVAEHRKIAKLWEAAVQGRASAVEHGHDVGLSYGEMREILGFSNNGPISLMLNGRAGQRVPRRGKAGAD